MKEYFKVLVKPKQVLAEEKKNATLNKGAINYAIAGVLAGIATLVFNPPTTAIQTAIVIIFSGTILAFITWFIAKKLGGKGTFEQNLYLLSLPAVVLTPVFALLDPIVQSLGIFSILLGIGIIAFVLGLYWFFIEALAVMEANTLSFNKGLLTIILRYVVYVVFLLILL